MKADNKNITLKNGSVASVNMRVRLPVIQPDNSVRNRVGTLLAVNAETAKENVRVLFDDAIIGLPALNACDLEEVKPEVVDPPQRNEQGLRTDGPTLPEFIKAGYAAENYPPKGYTDKRTDAELAEALKAKNALAGSSAQQ